MEERIDGKYLIMTRPWSKNPTIKLTMICDKKTRENFQKNFNYAHEINYNKIKKSAKSYGGFGSEKPQE